MLFYFVFFFFLKKIGLGHPSGYSWPHSGLFVSVHNVWDFFSGGPSEQPHTFFFIYEKWDKSFFEIWARFSKEQSFHTRTQTLVYGTLWPQPSRATKPTVKLTWTAKSSTVNLDSTIFTQKENNPAGWISQEMTDYFTFLICVHVCVCVCICVCVEDWLWKHFQRWNIKKHSGQSQYFWNASGASGNSWRATCILINEAETDSQAEPAQMVPQQPLPRLSEGGASPHLTPAHPIPGSPVPSPHTHSCIFTFYKYRHFRSTP